MGARAMPVPRRVSAHSWLRPPLVTMTRTVLTRLVPLPGGLLMSTFVIVPGAWDTPATMEPLIEPLGSAGHKVTVVDLPCEDADATLKQYADAVRAVFPDDLSDVVLVGYSFGGFTASRIAVDHPDMPVIYLAAWIPRDGASVLDIFAGGDPFEAGEEAGMAAFGGMILSAGPGLCALNIDQYVDAADPVDRDAVRAYLERTQRPQGITALREKWGGILRVQPRHVHPDNRRHARATGDPESNGGVCRRTCRRDRHRSWAIPRAACPSCGASGRRLAMTGMARPERFELPTF